MQFFFKSGEDLELRPPWRFPSLVSLQVGRQGKLVSSRVGQGRLVLLKTYTSTCIFEALTTFYSYVCSKSNASQPGTSLLKKFKQVTKSF